mgnify:FL=1
MRVRRQSVYSKKRAKSTLESLMYIWGEPLEVKDAADASEITKEEALECFIELMDEYEQEGRGIVIRRVRNSFQFVTRAENSDAIERLCRPVKTKKLTQAALETLAIVAYKQPVTRSEIDSIRGIKSDRILDGLMKKELICEKGRSEGIGRPILYGTTDIFLKQFGLTNIKELPEFEEHEDFVIDRDEDSSYLQMKIDV